MPYEIIFEHGSDYIGATVTGTNSREVVAKYMADIQAECVRKDCFRVLIDERLDGPRLEVMDIFTLVSEGSMQLLGQFEAMAYVDEQMGKMAEFAETVAINRGLPIAFFGTVEDARDWLSRHRSGAGEQDIFRENRSTGRD